MTTPMKLSADEIQTQLETLSGWKLLSGGVAIEKTFTFKDFDEAWSFMSTVAVLAKELNHHPEWKNTWNTVEITLSTHDVGGISDLDMMLAKKMDTLILK